jgi:hypothetical protein
LIFLELLHLQGIAVIFLIAYFTIAENMIDNHYKNKKDSLVLTDITTNSCSLTLKCILLIITFVSIEMGVIWLHWR